MRVCTHVRYLLRQPEIYDTSRSFLHGCSEGSAFAHWQARCGCRYGDQDVMIVGLDVFPRSARCVASHA